MPEEEDVKAEEASWFMWSKRRSRLYIHLGALFHDVVSAGGMGGPGGQVAGPAKPDEKWGYLDGVLLTESEATEALGSSALKFVSKDTELEIRWEAR